jgi:hypothetical protein
MAHALAEAVLRPLASLTLLIALRAMPLAADGGCKGPLFVIERSVNGNVVVYEAHRLPSGAVDEKRPVQVSWKLEDGRREELTALERAFAYGVVVRSAGDGLHFRVRALPGRELTLSAEGGCPRATTPIAGQRAVLERAFVTLGSGTSVRAIDLEGRDAVTGDALKERIDGASLRASR